MSLVFVQHNHHWETNVAMIFKGQRSMSLCNCTLTDLSGKKEISVKIIEMKRWYPSHQLLDPSLNQRPQQVQRSA